MHRFAHVDAFILAGGESSRMGRDKALVEIGGKPLLLRAVQLLEPLAASVTIVGEKRRNGEFGAPVLTDRWPGAGPLGAIATALANANNAWALILACDMPLITVEWLSWLCDRATSASADSFDALVPATANGLEPLCALYRTACLAALTKAL